MSLRLGGLAAILGAIGIGAYWVAAAIQIGIIPSGMLVAFLVVGSVALLVALTILSGFQARAYPGLVWGAFVIAAVGTGAYLVGILGASGLIDLGGLLGTGGLAESVASASFAIAAIAGLIGYVLFGIATYRANVLSRRGAALLIVGPLIALGAIFYMLVDWNTGGWLMFLGTGVFLAGWIVLGIAAIRLDRTGVAIRPAT